MADTESSSNKNYHSSNKNKSQNSSSDNMNNDGQQTPNKRNSSNSNQNSSSSKKRKLNQNHQQSNNKDSPSSSSNQQQQQQQNRDFNDAGHMSSHVRLTGSPAWDLQPINTSTQTFTGRCRLFVANLPTSVTEDSLRAVFAEFGQISDIFIGKGNQFAFIKMDTRSNAENAKNALNGKPFEGRTLRIRLAAHAAAIKVSNLPPCVSNELLHLAFSTFGPIERAIVVADDRGRSLNEGIIEFARKSSAQAAIKKCQNECLLLSASPLPVIVTSLESRDEEEGVSEKNILHFPEYRKEREIGPRFTEPNTVEHEIARKWKEFIQHENNRKQMFEAEMTQLRENFKNQMEYFRLEEAIKQLRENLQQMEQQVQTMNSERDSRYDFERRREEERRQYEHALRQQEEQLIGPQHNQNDMNMLRRQENDLRQQANTLQQILDRQEKSLRQMDPSIGQHMESNMYGQPNMHGQNGPPGMMPPPPPTSITPHSYGQPSQVPQYAPTPQASQQQVQHPSQMNHYGQQQPTPPQMLHQMHQQQAPPPMPRTPMGQYNGVPQPPHQQPLQPVQQGPVSMPPNMQRGPMNHNPGNGINSGGGGGGGYGKRNRRY